LADEGFDAREVQDLQGPEVRGELLDLLEGQVVALVEIAPVEAVVAGQVTNGIDEKDQERRRRAVDGGRGGAREAQMPADTGGESGLFHAGYATLSFVPGSVFSLCSWPIPQ